MLLPHSTGDPSEMCSEVSRVTLASKAFCLLIASRYTHTSRKNLFPTQYTCFRDDTVLSCTSRRCSPVLTYPLVTDHLGIKYFPLRKWGLWRTSVMSNKSFITHFKGITGLYWNAKFSSGKSKTKSYSFSHGLAAFKLATFAFLVQACRLEQASVS